MSTLDKELDALLTEFRDSIYPVLCSSNSFPDEYGHDLAGLFTEIECLQHVVNSNQILSQSFTTRGHQKQPYVTGAVTAMHALPITMADAQDLLIMIGVKHDASPCRHLSPHQANRTFVVRFALILRKPPGIVANMTTIPSPQHNNDRRPSRRD